MVPHLTSDWSPGRFPPSPEPYPQDDAPQQHAKTKKHSRQHFFPPHRSGPLPGKSAPAARDALMGAPRQSLAPRRPGRPHTPLPNTAPRGHLNHAEAQGDLRRTPPQGGRRCRAHRPPGGRRARVAPPSGRKKGCAAPAGAATARGEAPPPGRRRRVVSALAGAPPVCGEAPPRNTTKAPRLVRHGACGILPPCPPADPA